MSKVCRLQLSLPKRRRVALLCSSLKSQYQGWGIYPQNKLCVHSSEKLKESSRCENSPGNHFRARSSARAFASFREALEGQEIKALHRMPFAQPECLKPLLFAGKRPGQSCEHWQKKPAPTQVGVKVSESRGHGHRRFAFWQLSSNSAHVVPPNHTGDRCVLLTRRVPKRKDSLTIPSPFSTTKENAIYLNEEEVFNHTSQLQHGCSRNWSTQLSNVECVCIKQKPTSWISHTCQEKYLVLTHGVFDIYLQSWGDLKFTNVITMYQLSPQDQKINQIETIIYFIDAY